MNLNRHPTTHKVMQFCNSAIFAQKNSEIRKNESYPTLTTTMAQFLLVFYYP